MNLNTPEAMEAHQALPEWVRIKLDIQSQNPNALLFNGYDAAIIGHFKRGAGKPVVANYSARKIAHIIMDGRNQSPSDEVAYQSAVEYINTHLRTLWEGENTLGG